MESCNDNIPLKIKAAREKPPVASHFCHGLHTEMRKQHDSWGEVEVCVPGLPGLNVHRLQDDHVGSRDECQDCSHE